MTDPFAPFSLSLRVAIRPCRAEDLPTLEWWGLFAPARTLIRHIFERQERGLALMLVAEANGVASGQAWLDFSRRDVDATGVIWAVRVFPCLQGLGLGTRLMDAAEAILHELGFRRAELTVERSNPAARRFHERLGYREVEAGPASLAALSPPGSPPPAEDSQWLLRKPLGPGSEPDEEGGS